MSSSIVNGLRRFRRRFGRDENGAVLVEMALVTPFLLLLSGGVFEFSTILLTRLSIEAGVEDAARYIARCTPSLSTACVTSAKNLAVTGTIDGSGAARVSNWTTSGVNVSPGAACASASTYCIATSDGSGVELYRNGSSYVTIVEVDGSYAYTGTGLWSYLGFGALTLSASHQERVFGS
jgi:Flp pilus assembly protein TadG